jgi:hypothetical protein
MRPTATGTGFSGNWGHTDRQKTVHCHVNTLRTEDDMCDIVVT